MLSVVVLDLKASRITETKALDLQRYGKVDEAGVGSQAGGDVVVLRKLGIYSSTRCIEETFRWTESTPPSRKVYLKPAERTFTLECLRFLSKPSVWSTHWPPPNNRLYQKTSSPPDSNQHVPEAP